jgi:hypothetical protein
MAHDYQHYGNGRNFVSLGKPETSAASSPGSVFSG